MGSFLHALATINEKPGRFDLSSIKGRTIGQFIREKPNEVWFKAKFGRANIMDPGLVTTL